MGSIASKVVFASKVTKNIGAYMIYGWSKDAYRGDLNTIKNNDRDDDPKQRSTDDYTFLANETLVKALTSRKAFEQSKLDLLSDDALAKIGRQLQYFYDQKVSEEELIQIAKNLIDQSIWYLPLVSDKIGTDQDRQALQKSSKCPKVRFGKTELQISLITCGGMRLQNTWLPDFVPLLSPSRDSVLKSAPQENIKRCIKHCLSLGINHFETARFYGTSEYQITEALFELMQEGYCEREDFIFQTKIVAAKTKNFKKSWNATWANVGEKLGYIDLFGVHALADNDEKLTETMAFLQERKKEGKIKHIGFSTHGTSEMIMELINTEQFDYINIHEHYFGSYHGHGTPDTLGGHGNLACVKRAQELDMGIFLISPLDKGGKLYRPSQQVVKLCGNGELTPIAFGLLYAWKTNGFHTASIGLARPSDLDEVVEAARMMALGTAEKPLAESTKRLNDYALEKLGAEWLEKGLLNLPSMMDESTDGIAVGHILWLYNLLETYGMYEFCRDRYRSLMSASWNKKKSFQENADAMSRGNLGRAYDPEVDLTKALEKHYNPELALERIKQVHEWLKDEEPKSDEELEKLGWQKTYNLTVWQPMAGDLDSRALQRVMLQNLTGGRMGIVETGPGQSIKQEATQIRNALSA